ncbi:hypothetical protein D3C72_1482890 [compost metagenome]
MALSDGVDLVEIGALSVQRDRNDGLGARGDRRLQQGWIQIVGPRVDVDVDRLRAQQGDRFRRCNVVEPGGDDLVAGADSQRHLHDLQRVGSVGATDAVLRPRIGCELFFQFGDFRAEDVLAMGQHALDPRVDLVLDASLLGFEVDEIDHFWSSDLVSVPSRSTYRAPVCSHAVSASPLRGS